MISSGSLKQIGWPYRLLFEKERHGYLFRLMRRYDGEAAYLLIGIRGLQLEIEFPSDWHEEKRGWMRIGFGLGVLAFSFPWSTVVPDEGQCSGPRYGFQFFEDLLWIHYGKDTGRRATSHTMSFNMPWHWKHQKHTIESEPETHQYHYCLKNWTVQERTATIQVESRLWTRYWIPWRSFRRSIDVKFSDEVGERTGSWKGGTLGCSYELKRGETPLKCLRRMERERTF